MKYTKWIFLTITCLILTDCIFAQYSPYVGYIPTISADRRVDWRNVGLHNEIPSTYNRIFNVRNYGALPNDGIDDRQSIQNTIEAARIYIAANPGSNAVVYIPEGSYLLNSSIDLVNGSTTDYSGIIIKGDGSDKTNLVFPSTFKGIAIQVRAYQSTAFQEVYAGYFRNDQTLYTNTEVFNVGDFVEIVDDFPLEFGQVGQIEKVISKTGTQLIIEHKLAISYDYGSNHPQIRKLNPIKKVGIEDLLIRRHNTEGLWQNTIDYLYAADCWILGVESYIAYKHHVGINASTAIEIRGCYFHHASGHGEGGIGYGVLLENHTTNCLIEDNQFDALRHSMIVQSGANRNVFGYNYSWNREWETWTGFPYIGTGDISVHGNYAYANLFEGNKVELIWADDAHPVMNGPYNTFFRNDVSSNIIYLNQANYTNAVGNYVYNVDTDGGPIYPPFGTGSGSSNVLDIASKQYYANGEILIYNHAQYFALGFLCQANSLCMDFSYYYDGIPSFIEQYSPSVVSWPCLGTTCYVDGTGQNAYWPRATIPALERKLAGGKITLTGNSIITAPIISTLTSNPTPICQGSWATITCNLSQGYGGLKYYWSAEDFPANYIFETFGDNDVDYCRVLIPNSAAADLGHIPKVRCTVINSEGNSTKQLQLTVGVCGGGCPFVYTWNGNAWVEDNNILPQSQDEAILGQDVIDYYQLYTEPKLESTPLGDRYLLSVGEFEEEKSYIDQLQLLVIDHSPDSYITVDDDGEIIQFVKPAYFASAELDTVDVYKQLQSLDNNPVEISESETLSLTFEDVSNNTENWLLLVAHSINAKEKIAGNILTKRNGIESTFNSFRLRENPTYQWVIVPQCSTNTLQVDINWEVGAEADYAELSRKVNLPFTVYTPSLIKAEHTVLGVITSTIVASDGNHATLNNGDMITLEFDAPALDPTMVRSFVFVSKGRYEHIVNKKLNKQNEIILIPTENKLYDCYPNPFNPITRIKYALKDDGKVTLKIFNSLGEEISTLVSELKSAGNYEAEFNASTLPSGVYIYSIQMNNFFESKKMILIK